MKEEREEFVLLKAKNGYFSKGWQVCKRTFFAERYFYNYGRFLVFEEDIEKVIPLEELGLNFIEIKQECNLKNFFKLNKMSRKYNLFFVEINGMYYVRPKSSSQVIIDDGYDYEVAEPHPFADGTCMWVTEINSYTKPLRFAQVDWDKLEKTWEEVKNE